jgi:AcrR family transcriptional regulator
MTVQTDAPGVQRDRRRERGDRTRRSILEAAATLASVEGLEGLSIGRLADHLGISKSGLYAHFRSKEDLQLETIRTAAAMYERDVAGPALEAAPGLDRLITFTDTFFAYISSGPFPGGCFFVATSLDPANLRGRVKALLAEEQRATLGFIEECVRDAQRLNGVAPKRDPVELTFEIDAIMAGADVNFILLSDPHYLEMGRAAIRRLLDAAEPAQRTASPSSRRADSA